MLCIDCPFLEVQLLFSDLTDESELAHHGNWDCPQKQYFCALDPAREGWEEITPMLPARDAEEAILDAKCCRDKKRVRAALYEGMNKYHRALRETDEAIAEEKAEMTKSQAG